MDPLPPALAAFEADTFTHDGTTRTVYRTGTGPAVIVMAEIPGITPKVAAFAERVAAIGCTAVLPHLFGTPGAALGPSVASMATTVARVMVPVCVSREFTVLATGRTSPVVTWLRALAAHEHERCGGPGVGAVGMCFTGGFALAMAADERLRVPVLSQPGLPFGITPRRRRTIDCSPADLAAVKDRCAAGDLEVIGLRFTSDRMVPDERFAFLREQLGDAFIAVELGDEDANQAAGRPYHSVLTEHLVDEPGSGTRAALDLVLDHFRSKLVEA